MAIPKDLELLQAFIRRNNHAVTEMLRDPHAGASREYLWGARFMIKMLSRQWAADIIARRTEAAASAAGRLLRGIPSEFRAAASRRNGRLGGRPRKKSSGKSLQSTGP